MIASPAPARRASWRTALFWSAGILFGGYYLWTVASGTLASGLDELVPIVVPAATAIVCAHAGTKQTGRARAAWVLFGIGAVFWAAGDTAYTVLSKLGQYPSGQFTIADAGYLALIPAWSAALLVHPAGVRRGLERVGTALDAGTVVVAAFSLMSPTVLAPIVDRSGGVRGTAVLLVYPLADLLLVTMFAALLAPTIRRVYSWRTLLGAGVLTFAIADIGYARLALSGSYVTDAWVDLGWEVAFLFVLAAGRRSVREPLDAVRRQWRLPALSALRLVAILAIGLTALISREREVALAGAVGAGLLIATRQTVVLVENRRQTTRYESLLRALGDLGQGFVVVEAGRVVHANDAFFAMSGLADAAVLGRAFEDLVDESLHEDARSLIAVRGTAELALANGLLVEVSTTDLAHDVPTVFAIFRDITERRRVENEKRELDALRDVFIANAAHELRTPLTTLASLGSTLGDHWSRMSEEQVASALDALRRQAVRARVLVNNLLDLSLIDQGRLELVPEPVTLGDALDRVLEVAPPPPGKSVDVRWESDSPVLVDPLRFEQVITNLLTNAYRYGGRHIVVDAHERADSMLVRVTDDGAGVPKEFVPELFERFTRDKASPVARTSGSGLGLAISKRLVEAFGGHLWYEDALPQGASFVMTLPVAA